MVTWAALTVKRSAPAAVATAPDTYSFKSGALPPGLNFNTTTGAITGTPTGTAGTTLLIEASDSAGCKASQSYPLQIKSMGIGNLVFDDCNNNGLYDAGDSGLAGDSAVVPPGCGQHRQHSG